MYRSLLEHGLWKNSAGNIMIVIANDHAGFPLKNEIIPLFKELGEDFIDAGAYSAERTDYPIWAEKAARLVAGGECERGILICGTGAGVSFVANKIKAIRCVVCADCYTAKLSRAHNNANMLAIGSRVLGIDLAKMIVEIWLKTPFEGGRHAERVNMISEIEGGKTFSKLWDTV